MEGGQRTAGGAPARPTHARLDPWLSNEVLFVPMLQPCTPPFTQPLAVCGAVAREPGPDGGLGERGSAFLSWDVTSLWQQKLVLSAVRSLATSVVKQ
ncbi:hypothetical protein BaRGS_00031000 [Batillaria attramentaria]|uniref:Uncharacterized protein n=1 Tax=Batillaria attramentaria TaxID=370345 RepID=A0ABD0JS50_9CAEN